MRSLSEAIREASIPQLQNPPLERREEKASTQRAFVTTLPAAAGDRRLAFYTVAVSATIFLAAIPFAKEPLAPVWPFIPSYQAALVVCDVITAVLLFGQARFSRSLALLVLAAGYLFTACLAVTHALSFPGLFAPRGLLGAALGSETFLSVASLSVGFTSPRSTTSASATMPCRQPS